MSWPESLRLNRLQAVVLLAAIAAVTGTGAGLVAAGTLHPRVHGLALVALIPAAAIALAVPGFTAAWSCHTAWQALPDCRRCGRKMIPADVRLSWLHRIRYYRCGCGRPS
jgi:hypothetical protein